MSATFRSILLFLLIDGFLPPTVLAHEDLTTLTELISNGELRKACSRKVNPYQPVTRVNSTLRLMKLRQYMGNEVVLKGLQLEAYIIPSTDEHQNEFVSEHDRRLSYISGFSGSYGTAVITLNAAALWTDGRYHLQADDQIDCNWLLMREGHQNVSTHWLWLNRTLPNGGRVGVDPKLISQSAWQLLETQLYRANPRLRLCEVDVNLVDLLWSGGSRPARRRKDVFVLDKQYSGRDWAEKVADVRHEMEKVGADAMVVTALDEIAWLLNIRGRDIPFSPLVRSYVLLDKHEIRLFVDDVQLRKHRVYAHFNATRNPGRFYVRILEYDEICAHLNRLSQAYQRVVVAAKCVASEGASRYIYQCVPDGKRLLHQSPIIFLKAVKNPAEIQGMRNAHIRDAVAMCEFFAYFEARFRAGHQFTELEVVKQLNEFRYEQKLSLGNSFRTIVGYGANGAQPHYEPTPNTNTRIFANSTLVLDSGGQYYDGTTDVTRTIHLGVPSTTHRQAYTRVLLGQIQLSMLTFPANMRSSVADVMVRAPLWDIGLDYMHGTSHGIGAFLTVHEDPIGMNYNDLPNVPTNQLLRPGYFLSNEPGYYREGEFGIRLENILEVVHKPWLRDTKTGYQFLGFKVVTLVPYQRNLIDLSLLSVQHRKWLNAYNERIRTVIGAELKRQNLMSAFYWMMDNTNNIPEYGGGRSQHSFACSLLVGALITVIVLQ